MTRRRGFRGLSEEDAALWRRVARTVRPLDPARAAETGESDGAGAPAAKEQSAAGPAPAVPGPPSPGRTPPAPPQGLDRRVLRGIARGGIAVEAVLDLHGLRQQEAHKRLLAFLRASRRRGLRLVMVITGKGRREEAEDWWEPSRRGVLRQAVPHWLAASPFREHVVGWSPAHGRRGGDGALYLRLRREGRRA